MKGLEDPWPQKERSPTESQLSVHSRELVTGVLYAARSLTGDNIIMFPYVMIWRLPFVHNVFIW